MPTSHQGLTRWPVRCAMAAEAATSRKPAPTQNRPQANFAGLDGSRSRSRTHSQAKTGASAMMKMEFTAWYQLEGKAWPTIRLSVSRSAKRFRLDPACSNELQKMQEKRK